VATHDELTGVANRRLFDQTLQREWSSARRRGTPLSLLMIDIDAFKAYNDAFGHPRGDVCLAAVAGALQCGMRRAGDLVARYGGEEFVVILPDTDSTGAQQVAEELRLAVSALALPSDPDAGGECVSVSIGVATWQSPGEADTAGLEGAGLRAGDLVFAADRALYAAKRGGRNQVVSDGAWATREPVTSQPS